jgi:plastocyanin
MSTTSVARSPRTRLPAVVTVVVALTSVALLLLLLPGQDRSVGRPDATGVLELHLEDYRFTPVELAVPVGTPVTLRLVNHDEVTHDVSIGRTVVTAEGRAVGYEQDLLAEVGPEVVPASAFVAPQPPYRSTSVTVHGGQTVDVTATFAPEQAGTWDVGCFTGRGCHLQAGLAATMTIG